MKDHLALYDGLPALSMGSTHLVEMRQAGELYVDKTKEVRQLLEESAKQVFIARPRRFGKSLMLSTIECIYQGHLPEMQTLDGDPVPRLQLSTVADTELFTGTALAGQQPSEARRPVVRLDLSNVLEPEPEALRRALVYEVVDQARVWRRRGFDPGIPMEYLRVPGACPDSPGNLLREMIRALKDRFGKDPVVLVDEFDAPLTMFDRQSPAPSGVLNTLRGFFSFLKSGRQSLHKIVLTGVTRNAYAHPLSALNLVIDLTWDADFGTVCGFTEADLDAADGLGAYIARAATAMGTDEDTLREQLRDYYNGYRFDLEGDSVPVYNPWSLTRTLVDLGTQTGRARFGQGRFPKHWVTSGSLRPLVTWLEQVPRELPETLTAEGMLDHSVLEDADPRQYLLQSGYLTVKPGLDGEPPFAAFPNREVAEAFLENLKRLGADSQALAVAYASDDRNPVFVRLRRIMHRRDYVDLPMELTTLLSGFAGVRLNDHDQCLNVLQAVFAALGGLDVRAEPKEAGGWPDLVLRHPEHACAIELKVNRNLSEAKRQADRQDYGRSLMAEYLQTEDVTVLAIHVVNRSGHGLRVEGAQRPVQGSPGSWQELTPGGRPA